MANIFSLYGSIFIDNEKANKSIDETTEKGKKSSSSFTENLGKVAKNGAQVATAVVGATTAVVTGLTAMATKTADTADTFDKASLRTGLQVEELQRLNYAAGQSGVELSVLENSAKKLNSRLGEVSEGNSKTIGMFDKLGIAVKAGIKSIIFIFSAYCILQFFIIFGIIPYFFHFIIGPKPSIF